MSRIKDIIGVVLVFGVGLAECDAFPLLSPIAFIAGLLLLGGFDGESDDAEKFTE